MNISIEIDEEIYQDLRNLSEIYETNPISLIEDYIDAGIDMTLRHGLIMGFDEEGEIMVKKTIPIRELMGLKD
jgi:hypothetical protein